MRIISKFHDFYDGVQRQGMDKDVVYVRETKDVDLDKKYGVEFYSTHSSSCSVHHHIIGYCGKIFKVCEVIMSYDYIADHERLLFYKYKDFREYMIRYRLGSEWDFKPRKWWPSSYRKFDEQDTNVFLGIFHEYNTPLFLISSGKREGKNYKLTINPRLKDLEFQKVKDSYTAYQDIFQYVAGVLNSPENKMVKISDKDKIAKHGFDKWSFRQKGPKK